MRQLIVALLFAAALSAQEPARDYRWYFQQAEEAAKQKNHAAAIENYAKALELNTKPVNRPWYMYNLARQNAFLARNAESVQWLEKLWDDNVESLMISYVALDPAFAEVRKEPPYAALMKKVAAMKVTARPLAGPVQIIEGAGCALAASIGPDGILLVDSGYELASRAVASALGRSPRFIINTHAHEDHVAGNKALGKNATVIAHANVRTELQKENPLIEGEVIVPPKSPEYLPNVLIDQPLTLHVNGEDVRIVPLPSHSSGDVVVFFTKSQVLHMGDDYFPTASAFIFPGEDMKHFFAALDGILAELSDDAWVVSGHEPPVKGSELKKTYAATKAMRDFVLEQKTAGKPLEEIQKAGREKGYSAGFVKYFFNQL